MRKIEIYGKEVNTDNAALTERYTELALHTALIVASSLVIYHFLLLAGIDVWRQDSIYYLSSYEDKLASEGRWINYIFFKLIKVIPAPLAILISMVSFAVFFFNCAQNQYKEWKWSALIALAIIQVPLLRIQLEWPETVIIGFILLALSSTESKKIPDYLFFPLFSILFFGTYSAFYFLLPLLYLGASSFKYNLRILIIWGFSFIVGYLVANSFVYFTTGSTIVISDWRRPNPISDFGDLIQNILTIYSYFIDHTRKLIFSVGSLTFILTAIWWLTLGNFKIRLLNLMLVIPSALAIYVTVIPYGIVVSDRTATIYWAIVLFTMFLYTPPIFGDRLSKLVGCLLISTIIFVLFSQSIQSTIWYKSITSTYRAEFNKAIKVDPHSVAKTILLIADEDISSFSREIERNLGIRNIYSEPFGSTATVSSAVKTLGFHNIQICSDMESAVCIEYSEILIGSRRDSDENFSYFSSVMDNKKNLIIFKTRNL